MRTVLAIIVAIAVAAVAWFVGSFLWNLLNLARGEPGWLTRLIVEVITPGVGAYAGMHAAQRVAKQFSLDGLFFGFCAAAIAVTMMVGINMQSVAERAQWRPFDWLVLVMTPVGAIIGASIARVELRPRHSVARSETVGHAA